MKNFLILAFRSLRRDKGNAFINISGLALGIACCVVLFLVVRYESSFDAHHAKADRIYRVNTQLLRGDAELTTNAPVPVGKLIKEDFPEVEEYSTTYLMDDGTLVKVGNEVFKQPGIAYVGPSFSRIFDVTWLAGNPDKALAEPNTIVLSKSVAERYFGREAAAKPVLSLGKTITLNGKYTLKVTGLIQDFPATTDLPFTAFISFASAPAQIDQDLNEWNTINSSFSHFILLKEGTDPRKLEAKFPAFRQKYTGNNFQAYLLQPLREMHHDTRFENYSERVMPKQNINALILIGAFILLTACINFINLATAQSVKRSKEVGVRKVLGANRLQLMRQFITETFLLTGLAVVVALLGVYFILPLLQEVLQTKIVFQPFSDLGLLGFLGGVMLGVTVLAGLYPAVILSGFKPALALKDKLNVSGSISLRRSLIVTQFVIAQVLIIGTVVVANQLQYIRSKSLGFEQQAIITLPVPANAKQTEMATLRTQLKEIPGVKQVSFSLTPPAYDGGWFSGFNYEGSGQKENLTCQLLPIDATYLDTYGLKLVAGRNLRQNGDSANIIVNEKLLQAMHIQNPAEAIGRRIVSQDKPATIVGVVQDFHAQSLKTATGPIIMSRFEWVESAGIKLEPHSLPQTIAQIEVRWKHTFPESVFEFTFLDEYIANFYREEIKMYSIFRVFAGVAIFISCLGLYGLVSFMAVQRTKEIGIRKVLGASVANIVALFSKEFFALIFIAFAVAAPVAWYFMHSWLQKFEYRVTIGLNIFLPAILLSLIIAGITVIYRSVRAAVANPTRNLRSE